MIVPSHWIEVGIETREDGKKRKPKLFVPNRMSAMMLVVLRAELRESCLTVMGSTIKKSDPDHNMIRDSGTCKQILLLVGLRKAGTQMQIRGQSHV